jgi:hypothetical protein
MLLQIRWGELSAPTLNERKRCCGKNQQKRYRAPTVRSFRFRRRRCIPGVFAQHPTDSAQGERQSSGRSRKTRRYHQQHDYDDNPYELKTHQLLSSV